MKRTALALAVILVIFLSAVAGTVHLRTVKAAAKPSTPEFTLEFVDNSYDVPPAYGKDPYTGEDVLTQAGYHVENKSIKVNIRNQAFTSYYDNGNPIGLYYYVRFKGHFQEYWYQLYDPPKYLSANYLENSSLVAEYTETLVPLGKTTLLGEIPVGGRVDFQVQALIGYYTYSREPWYFMDTYDVKFTGQSSDWSNTQTIIIGANGGINWTEISLFAALGVIAGLLVAITLLRRKQTKK